jgi:hypothetical protein
MCASLALPRSSTRETGVARRSVTVVAQRLSAASAGLKACATSVLIPGIAVSICAVLAFGTVHAWLIVPIWSRLAGGLPAALLAGLALAWAFDRVANVRGWQSPVQGLIFGVYMFGTLMPATAVDAALRLNGIRLGDTTSGLVAGGALFALSGFFAGWISSHERLTALVCGAAALALMIVAGGPLPIVRSPRAAALSLGVAGIVAVAGAAIASIRSVVRHRL